MSTETSYTLLQLQELLRDLVAACPMAQNVWITAELSDVRENGGHCYMELLQKDQRTGQTVAKARATIWANLWRPLKAEFYRQTGQQFASGLTVMLQVSAGYHPLYGMNLNIRNINYSFTLGERERRRKEILAALKAEGVDELNKSLTFPRPCRRIAVVSAAGAAGYGDFMNQLNSNERGLTFFTQLFPAVMQGAQTAASVIAQLNAIAAQEEQWDCVCIIRGGGASTDLDGFDDLELARNVANFPLPVIIGIGHERDTTVLDYICAQRVKTPTAAAEFIVGMALAEWDRLQQIATAIKQRVTDMLSGSREALAYAEASLPGYSRAAITNAERRLGSASMVLNRVASDRIQPMYSRLDRFSQAIESAAQNQLVLAAGRLNATEQLLRALSPQAVLSRGYSITRVDGKALTSADQITADAIIETTLSQGKILSKLVKKE